MRDSLPTPAGHLSRRTLLSLATSATAMAAVSPATVFARQVVEATPAVPADTPTVAENSISRSLPGDASPLFRAVADAVVEAMATSLVPGAAIGLVVGDREEHAVFGLASNSSLRPVTAETLFQIGSISKTFTATGIWRLIDEGALDLDAPVRTYLPDLTLMDADVAEQVTVGNLLDHSAGWYGDEGFDTGEQDDSLARYITERLPQLPQMFPLGEFASYNNAAFTVLGRLIEVSTGTTYGAAIRHLVLDPLGLEDSLLDPEDVWQRPYADGHVAQPINGQVAVAIATPLWLPRSVDPAGGIWSTTRDLIRYARFHSGAGVVAGPSNVVHPDSLAQMQEPVMGFPGTPSLQMGRDWFVQEVDGLRAVFHGGDTLGQHAELVMVPEHNVALAVLTNGQGGGNAVAAAALNTALAGIPALASLVGKVGLIPETTGPADAPAMTLLPEDLTEYVGRYADPGQALTITSTDDGLEVLVETIDQPGAFAPDIVSPPPPAIPLIFVADDLAAFGQGRLPFIRDADGRVGWVSLGLRLIPRVDEGA